MTHVRSIHILRALVISAIFSSLANNATAQEICGLASVQYNLMHSDGFEGQQAVNAASAQPSGSETQPAPTAKAQTSPVSALGKPLGYAPKIAKGVAPTISIVSPIDAATLPGRTFEIRGTFTGPLNTGVSINGSPARTFGNQWVATPIRPPSGPFTISAIATAYDGATATATRNVTVGSIVPKLEWLLKQPGNIAPAKIGFSLHIVGVVSGNVRIDFNGDSVFDYDGALATVPNSYTYATAGVYTARVEAVVDNVASDAEISVVMVDVVTQRERACAVYGELRTALAANDLEGSVHAFIAHQQEAVRPILVALSSNRPVFAARLGTIANGVIGLDGAELVTLRVEEGLPVSYPLGIAAGEDGVWRITSF